MRKYKKNHNITHKNIFFNVFNFFASKLILTYK